MLPEPTPDYVRRLWNDLSQDQKEWKDRILRDRRQRYGKAGGGIPAGLDVYGDLVRSRLTWDFLHRLVGTMTGSPPLAKVTSRSISQGAEDNRSKREVFWTQFLNEKNGPPRMFLDVVADAQVAESVGIFKAGVRPGNSDDALTRLYIVDLDPLTWWPQYDGDELIAYIQKDQRPKRLVYGEYGLMDDASLRHLPTMPGFSQDSGIPGGPMVEVTEYTDKDWIQVYFANRLVESMPNPYGCLNCFPAFGIVPGSRDPDKRAYSTIEGMADLENEFDAVLTILRNAGLIKASVTGLEVAEGEALLLGIDNRPEPIRFRAGTATPVRGRFADPFPGATGVFDLVNMIPVLLDLLQRQGLSPLFAGVSPGANAPGYAITSLYAIARSAHNRLMGNHTYALTELTRFLEHCIATVIRHPVMLYDKELRPSDITDFPATLEILRPAMIPVDKRADAAMMSDLRDKGVVSTRRAREDGVHMEQPDEEDDQIVFEEAAALLRKMAIEDVIAEISSAVPQAPTGAPVGPGQVPDQGPTGVPVDMSTYLPQSQPPAEQVAQDRLARAGLAAQRSGLGVP